MLELFEASFKRLGIHRIHALVFLVDVGFFVDMKHTLCWFTVYRNTTDICRLFWHGGNWERFVKGYKLSSIR